MENRIESLRDAMYDYGIECGTDLSDDIELPDVGLIFALGFRVTDGILLAEEDEEVDGELPDDVINAYSDLLDYVLNFMDYDSDFFDFDNFDFRFLHPEKELPGPGIFWMFVYDLLSVLPNLPIYREKWLKCGDTIYDRFKKPSLFKIPKPYLYHEVVTFMNAGIVTSVALYFSNEEAYNIASGICEIYKRRITDKAKYAEQVGLFITQIDDVLAGAEATSESLLRFVR